MVTSLHHARRARRVGRMWLPLFPSADADEQRFEEARQQALEHPLLRGLMLSRDGDATLLFVTLHDDAQDDALQNIESLLAEVLRDSELTFGMTGMPVLRAGILQTMKRDQLVFNIAGPVVGLLFAILLFRRPAAVIVLLSGPLLGIVWTLGLLAAFGQPLHLFNCIVAPVAFTIQ